MLSRAKPNVWYVSRYFKIDIFQADLKSIFILAVLTEVLLKI